MEAILRQGKSLHLATTGLTLHHNQPQRLESVAQYIYLAAAHAEAVQLSPLPVLQTVSKDGKRQQAEPWQVADWQATGWRLCETEELLEPGAQVLVIRNMGLGDVLMLTPALHALSVQRGVRVHLATYAQYLPLVWGLDWIAGAYALGTDYGPQRFAAIVDLNWAVEWGDEVKDVPRADIFARYLRVKLTRRRPYYRVAPEEHRWARKQLRMLERPIVGIQTHASCPQRSYPPGHVLRLMELLQADGYRVAAMGERDIGQMPVGVCDMTGVVSLRQAAALIQQMDGMICPDSGLLHLSVAVGTPTVGLFGPIPPRLRIAGYPRCVGLSGAEAAGCVPCFDIGAARCATYRCMQALSPQVVAEATKRLMVEKQLSIRGACKWHA